MANKLKWYVVTRSIGILMVAFGLFVDESPERGTIIITGVGMLGLDRVARSEPGKNGG